MKTCKKYFSATLVWTVILASIHVATSELSFATDVSSRLKCPDSQIYIADRRSIETCWSAKWSARVSPECVANTHCGALALAQLATRRPVTLSAEDLRGGKNPGSVLCSKIRGTVVLARGSHGEEQTFCQASDRSLIDCNGLMNAYPSSK